MPKYLIYQYAQHNHGNSDPDYVVLEHLKNDIYKYMVYIFDHWESVGVERGTEKEIDKIVSKEGIGKIKIVGKEAEERYEKYLYDNVK